MADKKTSDDIIQGALERFEDSLDATEFNREAYYQDVLFARLGDQWPDQVEKLRREEGRPCLTINKLPAFVRQVVNDARQNKPSIVVGPVDNFADEDTAEVLNGIVRSVERHSQADVAYDTAIDHAVSGGFGFFRIGIDYAHNESFDLEAQIHRVPNPLMVHWDARSTEFDASDWEFAFVSDFLSQDQFKAQYPKAEPVDWEGGDVRDHVAHWLDDDQVRIAEYWLREEKTRRLLQFSNGLVLREDRFDDEQRAVMGALGVEVVREREVTYYDITRRVISGVEILEEDRWPGEMIPIVPVWGEEVVVDGRRHFRSMVRDAMDPQRMFNFWRSATTELVALAPKAPFIGPKGFVPKGQEGKWESANTRSWSYLEYESDAGPPAREPFAGIPAGALQEALNASDDMKSIIGIYDPSLGARSNETSGKAIMARQREADVSNFHFMDNLNRAIQYAGRVLVEILPHVYSPREMVRILGEDMKEKVVRLAQGGPADGEKTYDLTIGKYDVTVKSGASYSTQREETREVLIEIMRQVPDAAPYLGDVLLEHMDFQGADKVAKRLKVLLPPAVQEAEAGDLDGLPDEAQAVIMQAKAQVAQLKAQLEEAQGDGRADIAKAEQDARQHTERMAVEREKIARTEQTKIEIARIQAAARNAPAVGLSLTEAAEQAVVGQNADVAQAIVQMAQALQALAGPRDMTVVTSNGRTLRGVSAPTRMQ